MPSKDTLEIEHLQVTILFLAVFYVSTFLPQIIISVSLGLSALFVIFVASLAGLNSSKRTTGMLFLFHASWAVAFGFSLVLALQLGGIVAVIPTVIALTVFRLGIGYAYWRPSKL